MCEALKLGICSTQSRQKPLLNELKQNLPRKGKEESQNATFDSICPAWLYITFHITFQLCKL